MLAELLVFAQPVAQPVCASCLPVGMAVSAPVAVYGSPVVQIPTKTTVEYRRGILGHLRPVGETVVYEPFVIKPAKPGKPKPKTKDSN